MSSHNISKSRAVINFICELFKAMGNGVPVGSTGGYYYKVKN